MMENTSALINLCEEGPLFIICSYLSTNDLCNLDSTCKFLWNSKWVEQSWKIRCLKAWNLSENELKYLSNISITPSCSAGFGVQCSSSSSFLSCSASCFHNLLSFRQLYSYCSPICDKLISGDTNRVKTKDNKIQFSGKVGEGNRSVESELSFPEVISPYVKHPFLQQFCGYVFNQFHSKMNMGLKFKDKSKYRGTLFSTPFVHESQLYIKPRQVAYYEIKISPGTGKVSSYSNLSLLATSTTSRGNYNAGLVSGFGNHLTLDTTTTATATTTTTTATAVTSTTPTTATTTATIPTTPTTPITSSTLNTLSSSLSSSLDDCIALGIASSKFQPNLKLPGWDTHSFGYHSDDGAIFHGRGRQLASYGPCFGVGDVVGCGINYHEQSLFFTLNGKYLGNAFTKLPDGIFHPVVGIDAHVNIEVNFGRAPFMFPLVAYMRNEIEGRFTQDKKGIALRN